MNEIIDFPKIKSPFVRKNIKGHYIVTDEIESGYEWVFEDNGVKAVDKLNGTNVCCIFEKGKLLHVDNRTTRILSDMAISTNMRTEHSRALEGVINAIGKGWLEKDITGRVYGELIGPTINGNIHLSSTHYFVPFEYLKAKCHWKSFISNKYPKDFNTISDWFKGLVSLFTSRIFQKEGAAEGIVFYHPDGRMAKLRLDMFDWNFGINI